MTGAENSSDGMGRYPHNTRTRYSRSNAGTDLEEVEVVALVSLQLFDQLVYQPPQLRLTILRNQRLLEHHLVYQHVYIASARQAAEAQVNVMVGGGRECAAVKCLQFTSFRGSESWFKEPDFRGGLREAETLGFGHVGLSARHTWKRAACAILLQVRIPVGVSSIPGDYRYPHSPYLLPMHHECSSHWFDRFYKYRLLLTLGIDAEGRSPSFPLTYLEAHTRV